MAGEILKVKLDIVFKRIFADENTLDLLQDFVASLLEIDRNSIENIEVENTEILPDIASGKISRLDLNLKVDGMAINVEIQIQEVPFFKDRSLYYWSQLFTGGLRSGDDYESLNKCIAINLLGFNMFESENYHSKFTLREERRGELLTDKCEIHFFELRKIDNILDAYDKMKLWLQFVNAESKEVLEMLEQTGISEMKKAVGVVKYLSSDETELEIARLREKALHDEASIRKAALRKGEAIGLIRGRAEGHAAGHAEGKMKEREQTLTKLRLLGISEEDIKKIYEDDTAH